MRHVCRFVTAASLLAIATPVAAQVSLVSAKPLPLVVQPMPPPSTMLGSFRPKPGSLVTIGYDELNLRETGIWGDVREVRDATGALGRGVQLRISESQNLVPSFVDADEIPALLQGLDALIAVTENPTQFRSFELRYTTKDSLAFVAYDTSTGSIGYLIQAGNPARATMRNLGTAQMLKIRTMFETALQKLNQVSGR